MTWLILAHLLVAVIWDPVPVDGVSERYLQVAIACDFFGFLANKGWPMCWRDTFRRSILGPMATFWMPKAGRLNRREGQGHIGHSTLIALIISYARDGGFKNLYLCTTCWVSKVFFSVPLFCCRCSENKTLLRAWAGDVAINSSNPRATRCAGLSLTDTTGIWKDLDISHHFSSNSFEDAGLLSAVEVRSLDSFDPPTRPLQFLLEERTLGVEFVLLTISICVYTIWLYVYDIHIECIDN